MAELAWAGIDTPVGRLSVGCSPAGVSQVRFGSPPRPGAASPPAGPGALPIPPAGPGVSAGLPADALTQLAEYFSGRRRSFDLPLDWSAMSRLQQRVLGVLFDSVGYGETVSYGTLARRAKSADATLVPARAIGQVMGSNPIPLIVPCHRVVAADGLGGYSGGTGLEVKRWLLTFEGALPPTLDWEPSRLPA
ncbi:MAG TPA: methylated-DNA--[protein]-cysteine S-methyltransferase [Streptosporangiaceae bacterium]|nr:methylated-DNA--[protein]-cysteine S-methyltransferase [Streptosporangiaceae bacterium]